MISNSVECHELINQDTGNETYYILLQKAYFIQIDCDKKVTLFESST